MNLFKSIISIVQGPLHMFGTSSAKASSQNGAASGFAAVLDEADAAFDPIDATQARTDDQRGKLSSSMQPNATQNRPVAENSSTPNPGDPSRISVSEHAGSASAATHSMSDRKPGPTPWGPQLPSTEPGGATADTSIAQQRPSGSGLRGHPQPVAATNAAPVDAAAYARDLDATWNPPTPDLLDGHIGLPRVPDSFLAEEADEATKFLLVNAAPNAKEARPAPYAALYRVAIGANLDGASRTPAPVPAEQTPETGASTATLERPAARPPGMTTPAVPDASNTAEVGVLSQPQPNRPTAVDLAPAAEPLAPSSSPAQTGQPEMPARDTILAPTTNTSTPSPLSENGPSTASISPPNPSASLPSMTTAPSPESVHPSPEMSAPAEAPANAMPVSSDVVRDSTSPEPTEPSSATMSNRPTTSGNSQTPTRAVPSAAVTSSVNPTIDARPAPSASAPELFVTDSRSDWTDLHLTTNPLPPAPSAYSRPQPSLLPSQATATQPAPLAPISTPAPATTATFSDVNPPAAALPPTMTPSSPVVMAPQDTASPIAKIVHQNRATPTPTSVQQSPASPTPTIAPHQEMEIASVTRPAQPPETQLSRAQVAIEDMFPRSTTPLEVPTAIVTGSPPAASTEAPRPSPEPSQAPEFASAPTPAPATPIPSWTPPTPNDEVRAAEQPASPATRTQIPAVPQATTAAMSQEEPPVEVPQAQAVPVAPPRMTQPDAASAPPQPRPLAALPSDHVPSASYATSPSEQDSPPMAPQAAVWTATHVPDPEPIGFRPSEASVSTAQSETATPTVGSTDKPSTPELKNVKPSTAPAQAASFEPERTETQPLQGARTQEPEPRDEVNITATPAPANEQMQPASQPVPAFTRTSTEAVAPAPGPTVSAHADPAESTPRPSSPEPTKAVAPAVGPSPEPRPAEQPGVGYHASARADQASTQPAPAPSDVAPTTKPDPAAPVEDERLAFARTAEPSSNRIPNSTAVDISAEARQPAPMVSAPSPSANSQHERGEQQPQAPTVDLATERPGDRREVAIPADLDPAVDSGKAVEVATAPQPSISAPSQAVEPALAGDHHQTASTEPRAETPVTIIPSEQVLEDGPPPNIQPTQAMRPDEERDVIDPAIAASQVASPAERQTPPAPSTMSTPAEQPVSESNPRVVTPPALQQEQQQPPTEATSMAAQPIDVAPADGVALSNQIATINEDTTESVVSPPMDATEQTPPQDVGVNARADQQTISQQPPPTAPVDVPEAATEVQATPIPAPAAPVPEAELVRNRASAATEVQATPIPAPAAPVSEADADRDRAMTPKISAESEVSPATASMNTSTADQDASAQQNMPDVGNDDENVGTEAQIIQEREPTAAAAPDHAFAASELPSDAPDNGADAGSDDVSARADTVREEGAPDPSRSVPVEAMAAQATPTTPVASEQAAPIADDLTVAAAEMPRSNPAPAPDAATPPPMASTGTRPAPTPPPSAEAQGNPPEPVQEDSAVDAPPEAIRADASEANPPTSVPTPFPEATTQPRQPIEGSAEVSGQQPQMDTDAPQPRQSVEAPRAQAPVEAPRAEAPVEAPRAEAQPRPDASATVQVSQDDGRAAAAATPSQPRATTQQKGETTADSEFAVDAVSASETEDRASSQTDEDDGNSPNHDLRAQKAPTTKVRRPVTMKSAATAHFTAELSAETKPEDLREMETTQASFDRPSMEEQVRETLREEPLPVANTADRPTRISLDEDLTLEVDVQGQTVDVTVEGKKEAVEPLQDLGRELEAELNKDGYDLDSFGQRRSPEERRSTLYRGRRNGGQPDADSTDGPKETAPPRRPLQDGRGRHVNIIV